MTLSSLTPASIVETLRSSFWALPCTALCLALGLAAGCHAIDRALFVDVDTAGRFFWAFDDVETLRTLMSASATGLLGVVGILFSVTITTLALASQQYGPFVLRTFMQRRFVQIVLADHLGTALFSLMALYFLGGELSERIAPVATVGTLLVLLLLALVLLVVFIHFTATTIQASAIIRDIHDDMMSRFETLFAAPKPPRADPPEHADGAAHTVHAQHGGYLQAVVVEKLVSSANRHGGTIAMAVEPGDRVLRGSALATVHGVSDTADNAFDGVRDALRIGANRTPEQDPRFALRQLSQITLRALSPSLNDPQTADGCIDAIATIVGRLLALPPSTSWRFDERGAARVELRQSSPDALIAYAIDAIRRASGEHLGSLTRLVDALDELSRLHPDSPWLPALERQLELIGDRWRESPQLLQASDAERHALQRRHQRVLDALRERLAQRASASVGTGRSPSPASTASRSASTAAAGMEAGLPTASANAVK